MKMVFYGELGHCRQGKSPINRINWRGNSGENFLRIANSKVVYFGEKTLKLVGDVFNTPVHINGTA